MVRGELGDRLRNRAVDHAARLCSLWKCSCLNWSSPEAGVDDNVVYVAVFIIIKVPATSDQPEPSMIDNAVHSVGRELVLRILIYAIDLENGGAAVLTAYDHVVPRL